ncbi:MAG: serine hydrolase domain-containing protein [Alphaproteobacteria bacterium]
MMTAIPRKIQEFQKAHVMNGAIAVAQGGETVYANGLGIADHFTNQLCTKDTQFFIASITKQFTAAALLHVLWHRDPSIELLKAALHSPLINYLPANDSIWSGSIPEWAEKVSLHHMLTHTSGIPAPSFEKDESTVISPAEVVKTLKDKSLLFEPDTKYQYSYAGYFLLSEIIARLAEKSLSQYLNDHFFKPLGLHNTFMPETGTCRTMKASGDYPNLARGYTCFENSLPIETETYGRNALLCGAGGLVSTVTDLLKWNENLYGNKVLPSEVTDLMLKEHVEIDAEDTPSYYCYGIIKIKYTNGDVFKHDGGMDGFISTLQYKPCNKLSFVALANFNIYYCQKFGQAFDEEYKRFSHIKNQTDLNAAVDQAMEERFLGFLAIKKSHELMKLKDIVTLDTK